MTCSILEKDNWLDKDTTFMICDIIEYDMKRAGLSIIKQDSLLSQDLITKYERMPKKEADEAIGTNQEGGNQNVEVSNHRCVERVLRK